MTVQRINLYPVNERLRVSFPDSRLAAVVVIGLVLCLALVSAAGQWSVGQRTQDVTRKTAAVADLTTQVDRWKAEHPQAVAGSALQQEVTRLHADLQWRAQILQRLAQFTAQDAGGFSLAFDGLSQAALRGVWLDDIQLGQSGIRLAGHVTNPEQLPIYLKNLSTITPYQGTSFALVRLEKQDSGPGFRFALDQQRTRP